MNNSNKLILKLEKEIVLFILNKNSCNVSALFSNHVIGIEYYISNWRTYPEFQDCQELVQQRKRPHWEMGNNLLAIADQYHYLLFVCPQLCVCVQKGNLDGNFKVPFFLNTSFWSIVHIFDKLHSPSSFNQDCFCWVLKTNWKILITTLQHLGTHFNIWQDVLSSDLVKSWSCETLVL